MGNTPAPTPTPPPDDGVPGLVIDKPQGYYNGNRTGPAVYTLERNHYDDGRDKPGSYILKSRISYVSKDGRCWTVPKDADTPFVTDLASIPSLASWLVPKDGSHTPAALIHDAMVLNKDEIPNYTPAAPLVPREQADRLFREGMELLGVRFLQRWLMWSAVSIPTLFQRGGHHWLRRILIVLPLVFFAVAGVFGVPDIIDLPGSITLWSWIPWLGGHTLSWQFAWVNEASLWGEVWNFLRIPIAGGIVYAALWLKRWRFGLTMAISLSLLSFAMLVPAIVYGIYRLLEEVVAFFLVRAAPAHVDPAHAGPQGPPQPRASLLVQRLAKRD